MMKFGTDGWRAIISDQFTFENVRRVAQAIVDYVINARMAERGLVVGYDSRFLSDRYAKECAQVVAGNGIKVFLTEKITPTPVVSYAVKSLNAAGAIMVTASHNPAEYNGIKFKADFGGSALPSQIRKIEERLDRTAPKMVEFEAGVSQGLIEVFNPDTGYFAGVKKFIDFELLKTLPFKAVVDPMYGAAAGYVRKILAEAGVEAKEIRGEYNPGFNRINPEPIEQNLEALKEELFSTGAQVGLATDGDGDRVGAMDEDGSFINSHQIYALFIRHLVDKKGWQGGVVKTFSTTAMVDKLAKKYSLPVFETPIGFKYICELFLTDDILIGGEESGGIGMKNHLPERDGILCSLLLLEIMATHQKTLGQLITELMEEIGPHYYHRIDLHLSDAQKDGAMTRLKDDGMATFSGIEIVKRETLDGVKLFLADGSWILFRASGTEPIVRIYAEADSREKVFALLKAGELRMKNEELRIGKT